MFCNLNINETVSKIKLEIKNLKKEIIKIAKDVKLIERSTNSFYEREEDFLLFLIFHTFQLHNGTSLSDLSLKLLDNFNIDMKRQGVDFKLSETKTTIFLENVFDYLLGSKFKDLSILKINGGFKYFNKVFLEDSSIIKLCDIHKDNFKGMGRNISGLKLNLLYNIFNQSFENISILASNKNDQSLASNNLNILSKNNLLIRDLGYFKLKAFRQINKQEAFFLSRFLHGTKIRIKLDDSPFNMTSLLEDMKDKNFHEFDGYLGVNERLPVRFIIYKMPNKEYQKRVDKINKRLQQVKDKQISLNYKKELGYSIYITNIPQKILKGKLIGTLYKYRWEIELVIKELKSLINIKDISFIKNENKMKSILYARLIVAILIAPFKNIASKKACKYKQEVSQTKLIKWLLQDNRLMKHIKKLSIESLKRKLLSSIKLLLKEKRKRKYMREQVTNKIDFLDSFEYRNRKSMKE